MAMPVGRASEERATTNPMASITAVGVPAITWGLPVTAVIVPTEAVVVAPPPMLTARHRRRIRFRPFPLVRAQPIPDTVNRADALFCQETLPC